MRKSPTQITHFNQWYDGIHVSSYTVHAMFEQLLGMRAKTSSIALRFNRGPRPAPSPDHQIWTINRTSCEVAFVNMNKDIC